MRKFIDKIKTKIRERRIKRFKAHLAEAYPDASKFVRTITWYDDENVASVGCGIKSAGDLMAFGASSSAEKV